MVIFIRVKLSGKYSYQWTLHAYAPH